MQISFSLDNRMYRSSGKSIHIGIALSFVGADQPNTYGVPRAWSRPYEGSGFVGDVNQGSGCNFHEYYLVPHCNGTHTECVGHITAQPMSVHQCLRESLIPATLITVLPVAAAHTREAEHYTPALAPEDLLITRAALEQCAISAPFHRALVIRTLPNDTSKTSRDYMAQHPPFFTLEAMAYIMELGVEHLVVDMPSVDRLFDEGMLSNHHVFWNIPQGTHTPTAETRLHATITEFAYIPDALADGHYVLELQIAAFESDAAPSRPFLWTIEE